MAFDHTIDPMTGQPIGMRAQNPNNRSGLSPLAAATMRKMDDSASDINEDARVSTNPNQRKGRSQTLPNGQVPILRMDSSTSATGISQIPPSEGGDQVSIDSHGTVDRDVDAERAYRNNNYYNVPANVSKGRSDVANPNADIWGVSSEPWQDFAQPASNSGGLRPGNSRGGQRMSGESGESGNASAASSVFDMEAVMTGKKPARQDSGNHLNVEKSEGPKRSKSLIKKIRSARQNPNVPPPDDEVELGNLSISNDSAMRANNTKRSYSHNHSPSTPPLMQNQQQPYTSATNGNLGRSGTLRAGSGNGYYRREGAAGADAAQGGPTSPGLGRNNSIFGRFRGGGKNRERGEVTAR